MTIYADPTKITNLLEMSRELRHAGIGHDMGHDPVTRTDYIRIGPLRFIRDFDSVSHAPEWVIETITKSTEGNHGPEHRTADRAATPRQLAADPPANSGHVRTGVRR